MIRLFVTFAAYLVVGRWIYAEVQLAMPQAIPSIDYALEVVQIPTHDRWDGKKIGAAVESVTGALTTAGRAVARNFSVNNAYADDDAFRPEAFSQEPGFETF